MRLSPRWPQYLLAASALAMAALTGFAARVLFAAHPETEGGGTLFAIALFAYPLTLIMQAVACVGLYRLAKAGFDEPTKRTQGLIGLAFLSLAGPVLVFLAYALMHR
ncbi:hypothetical protein LF41_2929 [Lysobacter dokdonensis DS-58]|uniref:Transmembrane protein n=1 Tax=Lysobacter dokdonensis DS-58 TaxID=1300345 RepID=A0A0A2WHK0_9GAMM|nr:hypothetical protein [Lysobacter dokdonensis]KGQ19283.1 hypothetical protein LF41_2929 [Lysobacter dokdonensis DS-58]